MFPQFASRLIRNGATLGGNLGTGSPIGDTPPALLALDAAARPGLASTVSARSPLADYFTGYRQSVRAAGRADPASGSRAARRADGLPQDRQAPLRRHLQRRGRLRARPRPTASSARAGIGLGGVAATPIRASATEAALAGGRGPTRRSRAAAEVLRAEGTPIDDHRASAAYRAAMLGQSLLKLHAEHPDRTSPRRGGPA